MKYRNPDIESSYRQNDIGQTLYSLVLTHRPEKIIDFGVLNGYSTIAMAMALDTLGSGRIIGYDLFDTYPYRHSSQEDTRRTIERYGVQEYVELRQMDFQEWLENPEQFDMFHLDISNNGRIIEQFQSAVQGQVNAGALAVFEGGSEERDNVDWMAKYHKPPIGSCRAPFKVIDERFPSLSRLLPAS
jgi:predicted O-methyltransferase YrrM